MSRWRAIGCATAILAVVLAWALAPASGAGAGVSIAGGPGQATCPDVLVDGTQARGGCVLEARAPASLTAVTPFGDHQLARCVVGFTLRVSGSGELALTDLVADDLKDRRSVQLGVSEACGDVLACRRPSKPDAYPSPRDKLPWSGRLEASGSRLAVELDACFDTCVGQFEGPLALDLHGAADRGWTVVARRAPVGAGGLELDGSWRLEPRASLPLTIQVADG